MWDWCRNRSGWDRLSWIQRWKLIRFPWELRVRIWLAVKLKRAAVWVLADLVPDPFDEEGPFYVEATVSAEDGNEDG